MDSEVTELAVMPCRRNPAPVVTAVVTTVTPLARCPTTYRKWDGSTDVAVRVVTGFIAYPPVAVGLPVYAGHPTY
jgi:hypothetical protein